MGLLGRTEGEREGKSIWFEKGEYIYIISFRILNILDTRTGRREKVFKETYSGVYPKGPNSWIHSTGFKPF